mgnify:CR=1 FL=1
MTTQGSIDAVEPIGDGHRRIEIEDIDSDDITVAVSQSFGSADDQLEYTTYLDDEVIESNTTIFPYEEQSYDALLVISGVPVPEDLDPSEPLNVDISIDQVRQAQAAVCPGCGSDLRETFGDSGCTECGFHPL